MVAGAAAGAEAGLGVDRVAGVAEEVLADLAAGAAGAGARQEAGRNHGAQESKSMSRSPVVLVELQE